MLKLLKYDLKRDLFMLLGAAAAVVLLQLCVEIGGRYWGADAGVRFVLSVLTYMFTAVLVLVAACRSFRSNIRLSSRRLLPLGSLNYIASAGLYALLNGLAVGLLAGIHFLYYRQGGLLNELQRLGNLNFNGLDLHHPLPWTLFLAAATVVWSVLLLLSILFLVISVMESLQVKAKGLIGILLFFAIGSVMSWIEEAFFGGGGSQAIPRLQVQSQSSLTMQVQGLNAGWGAFLFELAVIAGFVWLTVRLIDRRVRIA
ncbi:hypothetical protein [Saccharibacillus qingshengii]|uniref:hypothetical protein n=1 Tax=Saccharibacillus qingshengii TaxID=1763540 RepID=UPI0015563923|nr:hypothetical protein [Saccharibacillus qingshengii]